MDAVPLYIDGKLVAYGRVTDRAVLHCRAVPSDQVVVEVTVAIHPEVGLPFPNEGMETVAEAVKGFAAWPKSSVGSTSSPSSQSVPSQESVNRPQPVTHIRDRYDLLRQECQLLHGCGSGVYGTGIISFADPTDCVQDIFLGDALLGVTVLATHDNAYGCSMRCRACASLPEVHSLVVWEADHINIAGKTAVQWLTSFACAPEPVDVEAIDSRAQESLLGKRKYVMVKRIPSQPNGNSKIERLISFSAIKKFKAHVCCIDNCCYRLPNDVFIRIRKFFWTMKMGERKKYILDVISVVTDKQKVNNIMMFGWQLCCESWWMALGISQATFYNYKKDFLSGHVNVEHGNTGTMKPKDPTLAAEQVLNTYISENSETLPHRSHRGPDGCRLLSRKLPSLATKTTVWEECTDEVERVTGKGVTKHSFNRAWKRCFPEVSIAPHMAFSKCNKCIEVKEKISKTRDEKELRKLRAERKTHMVAARSCRSEYWHWKTLSVTAPDKVLSIIHDKMDQTKTFIPRLENVPKSLSRLPQLKVSLTGALTHGHGPGCFGNFSIELWPDDSNFHVGSIASILRKLENETVDVNGDILFGSTSPHKWASKLLDNKHLCAKLAAKGVDLHALHQGHTSTTFKKLPPVLHLQADNCSGQNRNRYVLSFLSYLVYKGIFHEVYMSFMMVGHTHDDIDAMFGTFSKHIRNAEALTLPELMHLWKNCCQTVNPVPYLVQEVPDWKGFIDGFIPSGSSALTGIKEPLCFKFSMRGNKPIMQYKLRPSQDTWIPAEGLPMWKEDKDGNPIMPQGVPKSVRPVEQLKDLPKLQESIYKHVQVWTNMLAPGSTETQEKNMLIDYWADLLDELELVQEEPVDLCDFWPLTRQSAFVSTEMTNLDIQVPIKDAYVGPLRDKPIPSFDPFKDVKKGMLLLVRPDSEVPTWLAMAEEDPVLDDQNENYQRVLVSWWEPVSRAKYPNNYKDCWDKKWRPNKNDKRRYESLAAIDFAWVPKLDKRGQIAIPSHIALSIKKLLGERQHDVPSQSIR